jgi:hypothetical protein
MQLSHITLAQVRPVYEAVRQELYARQFLPEIERAPERIISLGGDPSRRIDYMKSPIAFVAIEVAMRFLFGNGKSLLGLQLASNYGPYLHYLRSRGIHGITGIDTNPAAIRYGMEIGSNTKHGNALKLERPAQLYDVIITEHFIDLDYLICPTRVVRDQIAGVLKPNGFHLSDHEVSSWHPNEIYFNGFSPPQGFSAEVVTEYSELGSVFAFQRL